jgi:hypothetical protein
MKPSIDGEVWGRNRRAVSAILPLHLGFEVLPWEVREGRPEFGTGNS